MTANGELVYRSVSTQGGWILGSACCRINTAVDVMVSLGNTRPELATVGSN